ncbi:hypothetical protein CNMCM8980_001459 [Aspergillus fumigatiaffinis]|nr:hypothetical protein CNMCM5878_001610 [Aspergillus fumigatiaffinis]KAF4225408.1 hypothetical protein CNMCM6457_008250 [Aspergillus fumigatiaffinis]KAF4239862.1 hypothetical protein CNMCM8980_001459 [Aspergillus fumigatiaffinis]
MFRARRYRVSLVFAVIFVLIFVHFSRSRDTSASTVRIPAPVDQPKTYPQRPPPVAPDNKGPISPETSSSHEPTSESVSSPAQQVEKPAAPDSKRPQDLASDAHGQASSKDGSVAGQTTTSSSDNGSAKGDGLEAPPYQLDYHGHARVEVDLPETNRPAVHWKQVQEHYPLAPVNLIKLPTGKSKTLPRVQAVFRDETTSDKIQRVQRLSTIKAAFEHAWNGYKTSAMGHDEIKPLRGGFRDPFMGWAATLVDSLDTLWIMDLKDEFAIAVDQVKKIDFTTSKRDEIPVFETVIRYLGGLLGAYDISGHKYDVLLEKAVELADIVMGAFDTPNRMPTMFYKWAPHDAAKPHLADFDSTLAEIGSLSVEFTRLAQLTKQDKYYDAIARITNELEKLQGQTMLPGLWPLKIDASGCRTAASQLNHEVPRNGIVDTEPSALSPTPLQTPPFSSASPSASSSASSSMPPVPSATYTPLLAPNGRPLPTDAQSYAKFFDRRDGGSLHIDAEPANYDPNEGANSAVSGSSGDKACTGGLAAPPSSKHKFGLGARGDSTYEYLPKEYMLLGGLNEQYPAMYKKAMNATREHLLFQPMVKDERDIRFLSTMTLTHPIAEQVPDSVSMTYEGTHLGCFAGGMFALGAKLFGIEGDLDLAAKLTNACVWAYGVTKTGIMPEHFFLVPCKKGEPCVWNETEYWNALDPNEEQRIADAEKAIEQKSEESDSTKQSTTNSIHRRDSSGKWHVIADSANTDDLINHDEDEVKKQDAKDKAVHHEVFVTQRIMNERLPPGVTRILNRAYLLRPEAIESVFYMFRITGDNYWREKGWEMFQAVSKYTRTEIAHSAINDVTLEKSKMRDTMESFWLAETLKYFYLLFADPSVVSLDDYVLLLARSSPPNQRFPGTRRDECRETTSPTTTTIELWEMEFEVSLENEQQFWDELQEIVSIPCSTEDLIDNALRSYLSLATKYKDEYLNSPFEVSRCSYKLLASSIFTAHADYVRRQMIYGLLQEDDPDTLHLIVSFLLFDGRQHEESFRMMNEEGSFPRLLELLQVYKIKDGENQAALHRMLMDLLYEMSRIQRIRIEDLVLVDDDFIKGLFEIIEDLSYDASDPYHYPVIRVLLVFNEQFMISAHDPVDDKSSTPLTNKVIKVLAMHGNLYKTFGENIILLINREAETSLQLLTLKLLYLIFTTPSTYEYFYTNDLHVLVDILIRNLLDLPEEAAALRHTYLRVLYPLLAHTQLKYPPHYKREELKKVLNILGRGQLSSSDGDLERILHFEEVDETTRRLVLRCATVEWLRDEESESHRESVASFDSTTDAVQTDAESGTPTSTEGSSPGTLSPTRLGGSDSPKPDAHRKASAVQRLGMDLEPASCSTISVQEVANQHEKPGVITPSRNDAHPTGNSSTTDAIRATIKPKIKPEPPKSRRRRGRRIAEEEDNPERIPEDAASAASSPVMASASVAPPVDRRNSTSMSGLAPPVPAHLRRSASNPPPALPPPRRSTHPAVQAHPLSGSCSPLNSSPLNVPSVGKHGQKPEPPKARRWARGRHAHGDSADRSAKDLPMNGEILPESSAESNGGTVSVEEAVQKVSLES